MGTGGDKYLILFNKVYKNRLENITFSIKRNEFVFIYTDEEALSVLRELISGVKQPDSGIIKLLNKDDSALKIFENEVGIVFKDNILLPERTVAENLKFVMEIKKQPLVYFQHRSKRILDLVNIKSYHNSKPKELLPHQLKRANIAQALLTYPSILILEDPTYSLDEVNSRAIFHLSEEINQLGTTIVFLTTDKDIISQNKEKRVVYLKQEEMSG